MAMPLEKRMRSKTTVAANETNIVNETFDSFRIRRGKDSFFLQKRMETQF